MTWWVAALTMLSLGVACSQSSPAPEAAPDQVEGVILEIDSASLDDIRSLTVKDGGSTYEIFIADDVEYGFPLGHLQEHLSASEPVRVDVETRDGKLYAVTIEDL